MLIDTHCHLNFEVFENNIDQVINNAKKVSVAKIIVPGTNLETSKKAVALAQKFKEIYAAVGIHPHHCMEIRNSKSEIRNRLKKMAQNKKVVAIGECGLDYYQYQKTKYQNYQVNKDFRIKQKKLLILQIKLASQLNLPLIIHCRQAENDLLRLITDHLSLITQPSVFHCFEGDKKILNFGLKQKFYFGLTGNITYNQKLQTAVKKIPLKKIILETDSPYLTPEPVKHLKKWPNMPENVKIVAEKIALIKGDSFINIATLTSQNAVNLFKLNE